MENLSPKYNPLRGAVGGLAYLDIDLICIHSEFSSLITVDIAVAWLDDKLRAPPSLRPTGGAPRPRAAATHAHTADRQIKGGAPILEMRSNIARLGMGTTRSLNKHMHTLDVTFSAT